MVILGMGGNLGDTEAHFRNALTALAAAGFRVKKVSSPYRNPAVGCEDGAPAFINIVLIGEWGGTPEALLAVTQAIEVQEGRPADHPHWVSRTLDIDIIACNGERRDTPALTLPHPRWRERAFVTVPLAELGLAPEEYP